MSTERRYQCDLCRDLIQPTPHSTKAGYGVYFKPGGASVFKRPSDCEHHICQQCAKSVHDEFSKVTPSEDQIK